VEGAAFGAPMVVAAPSTARDAIHFVIWEWESLTFLGATGRGTPRPVTRRHAVRHRSASTPTCGTQT